MKGFLDAASEQIRGNTALESFENQSKIFYEINSQLSWVLQEKIQQNKRNLRELHQGSEISD